MENLKQMSDVKVKKHFKKYDSIENSYQEKFIEKVVDALYCKGINLKDDKIFHVEEKIHGANFQFHVSRDGDITPGKRTSFLGDDEKFFNWKEIFAKYKESILRLHEEEFKNLDIIVYGELYGGSYPHPEITNDSKWVRVQREIHYIPFEDFICFDIFLYDENEESYFLSKSKRDLLCTYYGIPFAETLFSGTLNECLKFPNDFITTIPDKFGLPKIDGNICEGVVIRPEMDLRVRTGERAIIKNKNAKFTEKKSKPREHRPQNDVPDFINEMLDNANDYITDARFDNMMSKIGDDISLRDFGKYIQMFSADLYEDFNKDYSGVMAGWEKNDKKTFQKLLNGILVKFLKGKIMNNG